MSPKDPIQKVAGDETDLYDVTTWEQRTRLDALATTVHEGVVTATRALVVGTALLVLLGQLILMGVAATEEPAVAGYILLSAVPALALAGYIWRLDVTESEPLGGLVVTFILGFLLAGFAAVLNSSLGAVLGGIGTAVGLPTVLLFPLFFYIVVAPVEEFVKWLAIRLYAYRTDTFGAVVDGAVYGAVAGLGFATVENSLYITRTYFQVAGVGSMPLLETGRTAMLRSFAGPGHVLYSAFAGYYLGLAKFNPGNRGPIVVKGLLIAAFIHGTYNTAVTVLPAVSDHLPYFSNLPYSYTVLAFVIIFDGVVGYALYRKLSRYRRYYKDTGAGVREEPPENVEREDFED